MTPIHKLLARIRHDPKFGQGAFEVGYLDRFDTEIHRVALGHVNFPEGEKWVFEFLDADGEKRRVPLHRIREVYRDGALIWQRPISTSHRMNRTYLCPILLVLLAVTTVAGGTQDQQVWPGARWQMATPEEGGMDLALLDQAREYALAGGGSGVIVRYGRAVTHWGDAA